MVCGSGSQPAPFAECTPKLHNALLPTRLSHIWRLTAGGRRLSQESQTAAEGERCGRVFQGRPRCRSPLCCSAEGYCGAGPGFCSRESGCLRQWGTCDDPEEQTCGPDIGSCLDNQCCGPTGVCGTGAGFCTTDCQKEYGRCGDDAQPCGNNSDTGVVCPEGECCGPLGFCGTGQKFCDTDCQDGYGDCNLVRCGDYTDIGGASWTCGASVEAGADCCSRDMFCGIGEGYCDADCIQEYSNEGSTCSKAPPSPPAPEPEAAVVPGAAPEDAPPPSSEPAPAETPQANRVAERGGACGSEVDAACPTQCCSGDGICGLAATHCLAGCQSVYGICGASAMDATSQVQSLASKKEFGILWQGTGLYAVQLKAFRL